MARDKNIPDGYSLYPENHPSRGGWVAYCGTDYANPVAVNVSTKQEAIKACRNHRDGK